MCMNRYVENKNVLLTGTKVCGINKHFIQTQAERNCDDPPTKGGALLSDHTICHTWLLMRMSSVGSDNFLHHGGNMVDEVTDGDLG